MSDLTDFFPATGGGSLVSYDPLTLNRVAVNAANFKSKYASSASIASNNGTFWNGIYYAPYVSYGVNGAWIDMTLNSTSFQQIVSVSNVGKGGKLICVIGPTVAQNTTVTFKITIDGTATEIEYTNLIASAMRPVLGGILAGNPQIGSTNVGLIASPFDGGEQNIKSYTDATNSNGFANASAGINMFSLPTTFDGINQIEFKDTCVVEVKASIPSGSSEADKTGVILVTN
jgi:hypothetical protein